MKVSELYPVISYDPEGAHCAFSFGGLFQLAKFNPDTSLSLDDQIKQQEKFCDEAKQKFPLTEDIQNNFSTEEWKQCKKFSGLRDNIAYFGSESKVVITHQSIPFAPSLCFQQEDGFLEAGLHNCATHTLAVIMYSHALKAMKRIYECYKIDAGFLPELRFDQTGLIFNVPFSLPTLEQQQDSTIRENLKRYQERAMNKIQIFPDDENFGAVSVLGKQLDIVYENSPSDTPKGKFTCTIPLKGKNAIKRNQMAIDLFNCAVIQSRCLYTLIDSFEK